MKICEQVVVYADERYYSSFPSVVSRPDGQLLCAFRRAPDRRKFYAPGITHSDPNSYLMLARSTDLGRTWSQEPDLIYAHPMGGSQDPCLLQLDDGNLLLTSYLWMLLPKQGVEHACESYINEVWGCWSFTFLGGYLLRSGDDGRTWQGPITAPAVPGEARSFPGLPIPPPCNRGAMVQANDGNLYWAVQRGHESKAAPTALDLMISCDRGLTWKHAGRMAEDKKIGFNETSLIQTPGGDLVAFVRTEHYGDHGVVIRSGDMGKTWLPWQDMGIIGHPYHALRLPGGRVYLLYGYRHEPFGIRARVLDPECARFDSEELVLRADGGNGDIGYPWACLTADGRVFSVYYLNHKDGMRYIAGTFLEIE